MRIVATSDTHFPVHSSMIPDGDIFIHAGDLMDRGYPDEWNACVAWLASLPHKVKIYVPGNHDFHMQVYPGPALQDLRKAGVKVLGLPGNMNHFSMELPNKTRVLGLPYVTNLPRWAFNTDINDLALNLKELATKHSRYDIIVSHMPMHGVLDLLSDGTTHVGCPLYNMFCTHVNPKIWVHGHIHESYGQAQFDDCAVYNVAMCDRKYRQVNPPAVIDC